MPAQLFKDLPAELRGSRVCIFCNRAEDDELKYGKMYVNENIVAHYYCLLFSSGLEQNGKDNEGILGFLNADIEKEAQRGRKLTCKVCNGKGASVGCCEKRCSKSFHYPCGVESDVLNQYFGSFNSFCIKHRPIQNIQMEGYNARKAKMERATVMCTICHEQVGAYTSFDVLWAPCCQKHSWFHRTCMQRLALSAGYFFKCPICSNNTQFCSEMKRCGIYIPEQDASWEMEPNAFQELVERHGECDAKSCICPKGRQHDGDGTRWELLLCSSCGSKGVHIGCGKLHWSTMEWDCDDCTLATTAAASENTGTPAAVVMETPPVEIAPAPAPLPLPLAVGPVKRPHPSEDSSSSDTDVDVVDTSSPINFTALKDPPRVSRNVARRGRAWVRRASSRSRSDVVNFDHLRFRITSDNQITVFIDREQGNTILSYKIPFDRPPTVDRPHKSCRF